MLAQYNDYILLDPEFDEDENFFEYFKNNCLQSCKNVI